MERVGEMRRAKEYERVSEGEEGGACMRPPQTGGMAWCEEKPYAVQLSGP